MEGEKERMEAGSLGRSGFQSCLCLCQPVGMAGGFICPSCRFLSCHTAGRSWQCWAEGLWWQKVQIHRGTSRRTCKACGFWVLSCRNFKTPIWGNSLVAPCFRLSASTAEITNSILGQGTKILHAAGSGQNIKIKIETKTLQCDYPWAFGFHPCIWITVCFFSS